MAEKGQAALVLDAQTDARFAAAESIMSSGVRSLIAAPLLDSSGSHGMIVLSSRIHVRRFAEQDLELLSALGSVAALRIRNLALAEEGARRRELEKEMAIARQIQLALLPDQLPEIPGYSVFAMNDASRAVSGDFYEFQGRDEGDEQVIVIADVSGKGMAASLLAASFDALLMGPIEVGHPPDLLCARVSRRLFMKTPPERYVTAIITALDPGSGRLSYTNAGHNPGLLVRADGSVQRLEANGMPLGLFPVVEYEQGGDHPRPRGPRHALHRRDHRGGEPEGRRVRPRPPAGGRRRSTPRSRWWPSRWPSRRRSRCSPTARPSATTARSSCCAASRSGRAQSRVPRRTPGSAPGVITRAGALSPSAC